jgi:hypothetical protein
MVLIVFGGEYLQIIKLIMQFFPSACHFHLGPNALISAVFTETLHLYSCFDVAFDLPNSYVRFSHKLMVVIIDTYVI